MAKSIKKEFDILSIRLVGAKFFSSNLSPASEKNLDYQIYCGIADLYQQQRSIFIEIGISYYTPSELLSTLTVFTHFLHDIDATLK